MDHYIWCFNALDRMAGTEHAGPDRFRRVVPVLAALRVIGPIERVVDFGGSHGEYYQRLCYLDPSFDPIWDIVETPAVCSIAKKLGASPRKRFFSAIEDLPNGPTSIVVASGSLQYVERPDRIIADIFSIGAPYVLFSRMPIVSSLSIDRVTVQTASTMEAAYPVWVFSPSIVERIRLFGDVLFDFTIPEDGVSIDGVTVPYSGMLVKARQVPPVVGAV